MTDLIAGKLDLKLPTGGLRDRLDACKRVNSRASASGLTASELQASILDAYNAVLPDHVDLDVLLYRAIGQSR